MFALDKGELVRTLVTAPPHGEDTPPPILIVTAHGVMKRIAVEEVVQTQSGDRSSSSSPATSSSPRSPRPTEPRSSTVASNAQALRCDAATVSIQGRGAGGVAGMKLTDGAVVVGSGPVDEHSIVLTVTDGQTAKVTDAAEVPTKGRATAGVRITKFRTEKRLEWAYVGPEDGVVLVVGTADAPSKPDPSPQPLTVPHTARDLVSKATPRRFLGIGFGRW